MVPLKFLNFCSLPLYQAPETQSLWTSQLPRKSWFVQYSQVNKKVPSSRTELNFTHSILSHCSQRRYLLGHLNTNNRHFTISSYKKLYNKWETLSRIWVPPRESEAWQNLSPSCRPGPSTFAQSSMVIGVSIKAGWNFILPLAWGHWGREMFMWG